jgi:DNA polymerase V
MSALARCTDAREAYSIDEAFINLPSMAIDNPTEYASKIRRMVERVVGIPLSIGVAHTKTLAKLASEKAKKSVSEVIEVTPENRGELLSRTPIGDILGIGPKAALKLRRCAIETAEDFVRMNPVTVKKALTVIGVMTQFELQGQPCFPLVTLPAPPKSIQVSRTWGSVLESETDVNNAVIDNVVKAGRLSQIRRLTTLNSCGCCIFLDSRDSDFSPIG